MKAIVLAGGYGKRVMPLTYYKPKPMLPIANRPVIDYAIGRLFAAGISDITFALGYKPWEIMEYVLGYVNITPHFATEVTPMGTAGSVKNALPTDGETFVVLSADTIAGGRLDGLIAAHKRTGALVTIETTEADDLSEFGAIKTDGEVVTDIIEKNPQCRGRKGTANAGTYVIDRRAFDYVPTGVPFDFARDLFPLLLDNGEKICAYATEGYWKDVGTLSSYYDANFEVMKHYFPSALHLGRLPNIAMGGSLIADTALVCGRIRNCVIGDGATVASGATLEKCIVLSGELVTDSACGNIIGKDFSVTPMLGNVNLNNSENSSNIFRLLAEIKL